MIKNLKSVAVATLAVINIIAVVVMVALGYSSHVNPADYALFSSMGIAFPFFLAVNLIFLVMWLLLKRRMALIPIAGFIAACVPMRTYVPLNFSDTPPEGAIKVMSFNIKACNGPSTYKDTTDDLVAYLREERPAILCVQENMPRHRNPLLKNHDLFPYASDSLFPPGEPPLGLAIYSVFPIVKKERIEYPSRGNASIAYFLLIEGDTVIVINNHLESTHLSLDQRQTYNNLVSGTLQADTAKQESKRLFRQLADATKLRAPQAEAVSRYVAAHKHHPIILCGDFNDNPISYSHRVIAEHLTDCFVNTGCGLGFSYNQGAFLVRIDNIMCSDHFKPYACEVDNNTEISDHYPIKCWLEKNTKD